ncbi:MAG: XdhC family protein [Armatimonadota bacterium]|nr:XdhC family protein [Armatimonadota bacterium]MDR5703079.1 XdhC family protein [Armatimonadota bacterium]MDR7434236.1 XdhC family protein [Armatimonadota bacterium]
MKELQEILSAWRDHQEGGEETALATIVKVSGSTYRRPGARMLLTRSGRMVGSISGGCLEGDVLEKAREVMDSGQPRLLEYDMTADDDLVWGLGLGCNGTVYVFLERVPTGRPVEPMDALAECVHKNNTLVLATIFKVEGTERARPGERFLLRHDGSSIRDIEDAELADYVLRDARDALAKGLSRGATYTLGSGTVEAFIEVVQPPLPLVVCGAGHDAIPVVRLAHALGWRVTVADSRPAYATKERFPEAEEVILTPPEEVAQRVPLDHRTFVVIMTHNYNHDLKLLRAILPTPVRYIGVLGPRVRTERLLRELREKGMEIPEDRYEKIYSPVGLNIGAETPEEIALAILAEIQAVRTGRNAGFLRDRTGRIHDEVIVGS